MLLTVGGLRTRVVWGDICLVLPIVLFCVGCFVWVVFCGLVWTFVAVFTCLFLVLLCEGLICLIITLH